MCIWIELFLPHQIQYFPLFTLHRYTEKHTHYSSALLLLSVVCRRRNYMADFHDNRFDSNRT